MRGVAEGQRVPRTCSGARSTNGRGIHAYLVVRKHQIGDVELDRALLNLERWLQYQHHLQGWDIEKVEVKGRPPIFEWGVEKYELTERSDWALWRKCLSKPWIVQRN